MAELLLKILCFIGMKEKDRRKRDLKQRILRKKISAMFLAAALVVTSFPAFSVEVHAAELPDISQFATKEELKSFNTDDSDGKNSAQVYFGTGRTNMVQQWWIAGSQNGNLTLFATSPLEVGYRRFEPDEYTDKKYSVDWNCDYISTGYSVPTEVYPNHYGASPLRTVLKEMETGNSHFSAAEKALMNDTTIYTADAKNGTYIPQQINCILHMEMVVGIIRNILWSAQTVRTL